MIETYFECFTHKIPMDVFPILKSQLKKWENQDKVTKAATLEYDQIIVNCVTYAPDDEQLQVTVALIYGVHGFAKVGSLMQTSKCLK